MGKEKRAQKDDKNVIIKSKPLKALIWVGVILFFCILIFGMLHTAGVLQRSITAVTVGGEKVSALEYNIYYVDARSSFINTNYDVLQMLGYPTDSRLDSIETGEDGSTWGDGFKDSAIAKIQEVMTLCQEAEVAGFEMPQSAKDNLADYMAGFDDIYAETGYTLSAYINLTFGNGTKLSDIEKVYEKIYYAAAWQEYLFENVYTVSDEDIENYYQENKADYDAADYYSYSVPYTSYTYTEPAEGESVEEGLPASEEEAETMTTESKAAAQEHANNLLAMISDAGTFDEVASEYYYNGIAIDGDAEAEYEDYTTALVELGALTGTDAVTEWLKDESRTAGDKTVIEEDTAYTVLLFVSRYRDESKVVSARHILIQTAALMELHEITDSMTDAEKEIAELANEEILAANEESVSGNSDAKAWIDSILEQWENSDKSEGFFAELAEQYSEDSGSNTQGGLYENFGEGEMVGPFNDWCFDPARQKGDYDVIETEFGYHLMYMVEPGQVAYILIIRNILQNEMYSGYLTEAQESRDMATNNFGLKICF